MKRLMGDLGFILRNWRYFHAHHALRDVLKAWWIDYDDRQADPQCDDCWTHSKDRRDD